MNSATVSLLAGGTAGLLLVLTAVTAQRPAVPLPGLDGYLDRWSVSHGGYDPRTSFWARWWLGLSYATARPLARLGVAPDVLTLWGAATSGAVVLLCAAEGRWPLAAVAVVVLSGLVDSLDGAVAVLTDRATRFGFVLDSVVDRLSDSAYLLALYLLGAPGPLCAAAAGITALQEYARARAGNAGMGEIGVATVWERPTRIVVTAFTLFGAGAYLDHTDLAATLGAGFALGLAVAGLGQLLVAVRRVLAEPA